MKNKHLVIISSDINAGGISNMLGIHALALVREGYKLSIILHILVILSLSLSLKLFLFRFIF